MIVAESSDPNGLNSGYGYQYSIMGPKRGPNVCQRGYERHTALGPVALETHCKHAG
jgi:hypothetical protein